MMPRFLKQDEQHILRNLFLKCFGYELKDEMPVTAILEDGDNIVAFLTGYWLTKDCFYIKYSGIMSDYQGNHKATDWTKMGMLFITKHLGAQSYITYIENINIPAMKAVLNAGFILFGIRQDDDKRLYGQWEKKVNDSSN